MRAFRYEVAVLSDLRHCNVSTNTDVGTVFVVVFDPRVVVDFPVEVACRTKRTAGGCHDYDEYVVVVYVAQHLVLVAWIVEITMRGEVEKSAVFENP